MDACLLCGGNVLLSIKQQLRISYPLPYSYSVQVSVALQLLDI